MRLEESRNHKSCRLGTPFAPIALCDVYLYRGCRDGRVYTDVRSSRQIERTVSGHLFPIHFFTLCASLDPVLNPLDEPPARPLILLLILAPRSPELEAPTDAARAAVVPPLEARAVLAETLVLARDLELLADVLALVDVGLDALVLVVANVEASRLADPGAGGRGLVGEALDGVLVLVLLLAALLVLAGEHLGGVLVGDVADVV